MAGSSSCDEFEQRVHVAAEGIGALQVLSPVIGAVDQRQALARGLVPGEDVQAVEPRRDRVQRGQVFVELRAARRLPVGVDGRVVDAFQQAYRGLRRVGERVAVELEHDVDAGGLREVSDAADVGNDRVPVGVVRGVRALRGPAQMRMQGAPSSTAEASTSSKGPVSGWPAR